MKSEEVSVWNKTYFAKEANFFKDNNDYMELGNQTSVVPAGFIWS